MPRPITLHSGKDARKLPSAAEMAELDQRTIQSGVPSHELMDRAGKAIAAKILERPPANLGSACTAIVACGPGNNGGDGFVIAHELRARGCDVTVILSAAERYSPDLLMMGQRFLSGGGRIAYFPNEPKSAPFKPSASFGSPVLSRAIQNCNLVVDALLGTGQKESPRGVIVEIIKAINDRKDIFKVAVDVPTGISADTGQVFEPHIEADLTVAVQAIKRGMLQSPGRQDCGELISVDIGIDCSKGVEFELLDQESAPKLPPRNLAAHKGSFGHVFVIGGSRDMPGAAILSAHAALRSGAGLVSLAKLESSPEFAPFPEIILRSIENNSRGSFGPDSIPAVVDLLDTVHPRISTVVLGPGIGTAPETERFLISLIPELKKRNILTVLDADALNLIAALGEKAPDISGAVITPHPGEAARLLGVDTEEIQRDRYSSARALFQKTSSISVLKGAATVIYHENRGWVNATSGNPFMATAGSGDILAGLIAGLAAQGLTLFDAARLGVYVHGRAGDKAHEAHGGPIIASDMLAYIPALLAVV